MDKKFLSNVKVFVEELLSTKSLIKNLKKGGSVCWRGSTEIQMQVSLHSIDCIKTNICLNLKIHRFLMENNHWKQSFQSDSLQIDQYQY